MSSTNTRREKPWTPLDTRADALGRDATLPLPGRRWVILAVAVAIAIVLLGLTGYVVQWLWMRQLDYVGIFWTLLSVQWAMGVLAFGLAFGFLWLNLRRAVQVNIASSARGMPWGAALGSGRRCGGEGSNRAFAEIGEIRPQSLSAPASPCFSRSPCSHNGTLISASVTANPSAWPIRCTMSMLGSMSFICRSTKCCSAGCWCS